LKQATNQPNKQIKKKKKKKKNIINQNIYIYFHQVLKLINSLGVNVLLNYQLILYESQAFKLTDIVLGVSCLYNNS